MAASPGHRPRIAPFPPDAPEMMAAVPLAARGAKATAAVGTMLRNRPLYDVWRPLARYLNGQSIIPVRERELLVLRTAWLARSDYEWGNHVLVGRQAGLTEAEIAAVAAGPDDGSWSPEDALLLRTVDELVRTSALSDAIWEQLSARFSEAELIEIIMLIGHYLMVGFVFNSVRIQREEGVPGFEVAGVKPEP